MKQQQASAPPSAFAAAASPSKPQPGAPLRIELPDPAPAPKREPVGSAGSSKLSPTVSSGLECLLAACQLAAEQEAQLGGRLQVAGDTAMLTAQARSGTQSTSQDSLSLPREVQQPLAAATSPRQAQQQQHVSASQLQQQGGQGKSNSASGGGSGGLEPVDEMAEEDEAEDGSSPTESPWADVSGPTALSCAPKHRRHKSKVRAKNKCTQLMAVTESRSHKAAWGGVSMPGGVHLPPAQPPVI